MISNNSVVQPHLPHRNKSRGDAEVTNIPKKEWMDGNTKITVFSPLVEMTAEERTKWFEEEWEKRNPVLLGIAEAVNNCYRIGKK
ncbi:hypothetical protein ACSVDA_21390 [Cytobacillus sp. Hm23]